MKLKYTFETTELSGEYIAVPVGDNADGFKGVLNLNASGVAILKLMKEDTTVDGIVTELMKEYDGTKEELTAFVEKFTAKLQEEGLLAE